MLDERAGRAHFWLMVIGFNLTFFVQHFLGFAGMPRRVYTYPDVPTWGALNLASTVGAFVMGLAALVFVYNIVQSLRAGERATDNPWDAWTLEWATTSPPPAHNFDAVPPIRGRRPLWDLAHADGEPAKEEAPTGDAREPILDKDKVGVGAFVVSEAGFFLILIIAYVFFGKAGQAGPSASSTLDAQRTGIYTALLLASSVTLRRAEKAETRSARRAYLALTVGLGAAFMAGQAREYAELFDRGVTVSTNLFATSFFTLTGFHGLHVTMGLVALLIVLGLALRDGDLGKDRVPRSRALEAIGIYWHFVDVVWIVVFAVVYLRVGP
jgi:cytochrome c oxidase subunit 1/cytochrome c oxidase subunit I+III